MSAILRRRAQKFIAFLTIIPEEKIKVMHDQKTGSGGLALGLVTILATSFCIEQLGQSLIVQALIASEASAKLAMVAMARAGRSAHKGMNTYFVDAMHGRRRNLHLLIALARANP